MSNTSHDPLWNRLAVLPNRPAIDPSALDGLPAPARRFLTASLASGVPIPARVRLTMHGTIRLKLDGSWLPFTAEQLLAPPVGFVWRARVGKGPLRFSGSDRYADGAGAMDFRLWGLVPVARASNADVTRSARHRLAAESFWLPSSLLPSSSACWRGLDNDHAEVNVTIDGETVRVILGVDDAGTVRSVHLDRWGAPEGGTAALHPFGGLVEQPRRFGPLVIPTRVRVGWFHGTDRADHGEFFRAVIDHAELG